MIDGMRRLISPRGNLLGAVAAAAALAAGALASSAQALPVALSSVACPSGSECIAVGEGQEGTFDPAKPVSPTTIPAPIDSGGSLVGVACPAGSRYCTAVAGGGQEVSFEPGSGTTISAPVEIDENGGLIGLACPTETRCTAVDHYGYEVTFNPVSGVVVAGSFERIDASGGITSVACPGEKQCTVVDFNGQEVTFEPVSNRQISLERLEVGELSSVACPSSTQCTAVDAGGHEVTFEPASPGTPALTTIDGTNGLTGVACPTVSQCTAVDSSGQAVTFEPSPYHLIISPATIDSGNGLTGVACPTVSQCTAVDRHGHEVTFEPKSGATNPSSTTIGGGGAPSSTKSKISVKPNPTLVSEPGGLVSFEVIVTVEDENEELLQGDSVSLELNRFEGSTPVNPEITNSKGEATFAKVTCFAPYCEAGDGVSVNATDPSGLSLTTTEHVSGIFFVGKSYEGQTDTLEVRGLPEADEQEQPVTLSLNSLPVALSVPCTTSSTGSLPFVGELDACTFEVPAIPYPTGQTPPASIPAVVTVGTQAFDVTFPLQPVPSVQLSPTSGLERSVITVNGIGFPHSQSVTVNFTAASASAPSASIKCQTNGDGEIINDEPIGKPDSCDLTVPADSPVGKGTVSVEGYVTAHAPFTVEEATLVGIGIASNLPGNVGGSGGHLYVGETATLEIEGHYNTGTIKSLEVPAGDVSWSPEPQPSGAIELNVVNGHTIGLTAKERTKSTGGGVVKVTYQGFEAKSEPIKVMGKPCKGCTFVNGALLNVKAQAPGSTPVDGAIANITQGVGSAPVFTLPPPCIPENGGCSSTYPDLEESATETCTTLGAGQCQMIAGEGTIAVASEIEDTITLTAPAGYSVTKVKGCHSESGSPEAPVCHLLLPEFSNPTTITFELKPEPTLTVNVGGPETPSEVHGLPTDRWLNEEVDGAIAKITPTGSTPGSTVTCEVEEGEETYLIGGKQAKCTRSLAPGTYEVSAGPVITLNPGLKYGKNAYVTSTDPQPVTLKAGEGASVSFNTAYLKSSASGSSIESSKPAEAIDGSVLKATATGGTGTVIVGQYESDPVGALAFESGSTGQYIDVFLSPENSFTNLSFEDCDLNGGEYLYWYDPKTKEWERVSDETAPSGNPSCITVTINKSTKPDLEQMTGTVFGVALPPASTPGSTTGGGGGSSTPPASSTTPATTTPPATPAATGSISLDGSSITVQSGGAAAVKLTCTGTATCTGKLTLTARTKGKKKAKTETIGTASFSIPAGKTAAVKLALNATGRALLNAAHRHLSATLTILKASPSPTQTNTDSVHLTQQKATKAKKGKKK